MSRVMQKEKHFWAGKFLETLPPLYPYYGSFPFKRIYIYMEAQKIRGKKIWKSMDLTQDVSV